MKQTWKNMKFLMNLSNTICPYYWGGRCLDEFLQIWTTCLYIFLPKLIIDSLVHEKQWEIILSQIILFIGVLAIGKIIDVASRTYRNANSNQAEVDTIKHYCGLYSEMDYEKFESSDIRNLLEMVMGRIRGKTSVDSVLRIAACMIQIFVYAVVISTLSAWILVILIFMMAIRVYVNQQKNKIEDDTIPGFKKNGRLFRYIDQAMIDLKFAKEIRTNQADKLFEEKYGENIQERYKLNTEYHKRLLKMDSVNLFLNALELFVLYGYAGYLAVQGEITLGSLTMYIASVSAFTNMVSDFIRQIMDLKFTLTYVDKYYLLKDMMQNEKRKQYKEKSSLPKGPYTFEFCNVSFSYPNTEKMILKNINLKISSGEKVSIVGKNGEGKTTFIKLLCGIYVPTSGQILVNGVDIQSIDKREYASLIAAVFQDYKLFSFDIKENILLNEKENDEKLQWIIKQADLEEKIKMLPNGIFTHIDKQFATDGIEFSGGERQKLALARAYYKDSPLVILDEPTAAMDPIAELKLYSRFSDIIGKKTTLFISHRLASTKFCDKILVFSGGNIVEQGTHSELMQLKGTYYEMFCLQMELYAGDTRIHFETDEAAGLEV